MKNKGFTLIELLCVIVVLAFLFVIILPVINNIISKSKTTVYNKQLKTILNAAIDYTYENTFYLPDENEKNYIIISKLKKEGLIDNNIVDPKTNKEFSNDIVISIENVKNKKVKETDYQIKNGFYLYTIEENSNSNAPTIVLPKEKIDSTGNYISTIDYKSNFEDFEVKAYSSTNEDLTSDIIKLIEYDNKLVSDIDTSKFGTYKINYSVIDNNGFSKSINHYVVIKDISAPIIELPTSTRISKSVNEYDLLDNVKCIDNTSCIIEYYGNVEYGKSGKYIIRYEAKDEYGNTSSAKRVITIE